MYYVFNLGQFAFKSDLISGLFRYIKLTLLFVRAPTSRGLKNPGIVTKVLVMASRIPYDTSDKVMLLDKTTVAQIIATNIIIRLS